MRLFLDQMIDRCIAEVLRTAGHDVEAAAQVGMARADDLEILEYCVKHDRVLVTLDEHFGDWTVAKLTTHAGVIRLKVHPTGSRTIEQVLVPFLRRYAERDFHNTLVIVRPTGVRWVHTPSLVGCVSRTALCCVPAVVRTGPQDDHEQRGQNRGKDGPAEIGVAGNQGHPCVFLGIDTAHRRRAKKELETE